MKILRHLWQDERGVLATTDLLLLTTLLVIGMIVGLTTLRDSLVQELADLGSAVGALDQSYSFEEVVLTFNGNTFSVAGSSFGDPANVCNSGINVTIGPTSQTDEGTQ